jgi:uncharacterized protein YkwD
VVRTIGILFGLSLMLSACDFGQMTDATGARPATPPVAAQQDTDVEATPARADRRQAAADRRTAVRDRAGRADTDRAEPERGDADPAPGRPGTSEDTRTPAQPDEPKPPAQPDEPKSQARTEPAGQSTDDGGSAPSGGLSAIEQEIYELLNAQRQEAGLQSLTEVGDISDGAREWSCSMASSRTLRHANLRSAGVNGENIAYGQRSAAAVTKGWNNSSGHYRNRMSSRWSEYGVGVCERDGTLWFTERFR